MHSIGNRITGQVNTNLHVFCILGAERLQKIREEDDVSAPLQVCITGDYETGKVKNTTTG